MAPPLPHGRNVSIQLKQSVARLFCSISTQIVVELWLSRFLRLGLWLAFGTSARETILPFSGGTLMSKLQLAQRWLAVVALTGTLAACSDEATAASSPSDQTAFATQRTPCNNPLSERFCPLLP
jgi:hypothetical protein